MTKNDQLKVLLRQLPKWAMFYTLSIIKFDYKLNYEQYSQFKVMARCGYKWPIEIKGNSELRWRGADEKTRWGQAIWRGQGTPWRGLADIKIKKMSISPLKLKEMTHASTQRCQMAWQPFTYQTRNKKVWDLIKNPKNELGGAVGTFTLGLMKKMEVTPNIPETWNKYTLVYTAFLNGKLNRV